MYDQRIKENQKVNNCRTHHPPAGKVGKEGASTKVVALRRQGADIHPLEPGTGMGCLLYTSVMPSMDELILEEPEIMRQGGRYGVRLKANAPSIHMFKVDIESTVSPIVGNEKQSEDMVNYLMEKFEGDTAKIWESNIFGRSFHELVNEDLQAKLQRMPEDARKKFQETLQRIVNEGSGGLICIIL